MIDIVTDLLGKRVTVSMWIAGEVSTARSGHLERLITGIVRAMGSSPDGFQILVQTEVVHRASSRKVGALTMFTISPRGGIEVIPESAALSGYRRLQESLRVARLEKNQPLQATILDTMQRAWGALSQDDRDTVVGSDSEPPASKP